MKAKLNIHLLSTLPRVLRMTHNEVSEASGISIAQWYRLAKTPDKITVQQLLGLANGLSVPVSRFFSFGKTEIIGMREDYVIPNYQKCYYDSEAVQQRIGRGTATSWREAAETIGMHWTSVSASLLAVSHTPVVRLLTICETFHFDPFEFLIDPNVGEPKRKRNAPPSPGSNDDNLRDEIATLRKNVADLTNTVSALSDKYASLFEAHKLLLDRFNEHIMDGVMGKAADPLEPRQ